jgi:hypothetical protein
MNIVLNTDILTPVLALITWTLVMWAWMYATRIPAMGNANIDADDAKHPGSLDILPSNVRSIADNYNHLHEQPTVFYALAFYLALTGGGDALAVNLAWGYVIVRVIHSLVQSLGNKVMLRFPIFALSSIVLIVLTVRALLAL